MEHEKGNFSLMRMIVDVLVLGAVAYLYFNTLNYELQSFLMFASSGAIIAYSESTIYFLLVLVLLYILDFTFIRFWNLLIAAITIILASLALQNWILGVIFGAIIFILSSITSGKKEEKHRV